MKNDIKTKWNFGLLYKNENDPQIEKDFALLEKSVLNFEKKYSKSSKYLSESTSLFNACDEYEKLYAKKEIFRPARYFGFKVDLNSNDIKAKTRINSLRSKYAEIGNKMIFFQNRLGKISKKQQAIFLKEKKLSKYHYFLKRIFLQAKHTLSEPEEKVLNLMAQPSRNMWISGFEKVLNNQQIKFKNKNIPIHEAFGMASSLSTKDRRNLHKLLMQKSIEIADFAEAELNAVYSRHKITDELRKYPKPYSETVQGYENEDKTVENLLSAVTKNFKISHRFYKIKAKLLKERKISYADRSAKVGDNKKTYSFKETVKIVGNAFSKFDKKYGEIFKSYLEKGQIDVYPKNGKSGGAYCASTYGLPTFVLLNHTNNFNSVMTLGHEMGHAFHSEMSHLQPPIYSDYTTAVAEVASTLFENFVFEEIFEKLSVKEKIIALHDKLNASISTIFRQVSCFTFELEAHELLRKQGFVSKEEFAGIMNKHMKNYLGPVFDLKPEDGYFFVSWPHIRNHFYVYSYAFGALISDALFAKYKKDKKFIKNIEIFLKAGGSKCPEDIFKEAGLDVRKKEFFVAGLKKIESDIIRLEKLIK